VAIGEMFSGVALQYAIKYAQLIRWLRGVIRN